MRPLDPMTLPLAGTHLIEASAGTGKTYTITTLLLRLLLEGAFGIDQILVVTYTRAATGELRDRVRRRLVEAVAAIEETLAGAPVADPTLQALIGSRPVAGLDADRRRLAAALRRLDEAAIFTIHGFCQRALSEWAFESGQPFEQELAEDSWAMLVDVVRDHWAHVAYAADPTHLAFWRQSGADLPDFTRIASLVTANPALTLVPERPPSAPDFDAAAHACACVEVGALWRDARPTLVRILLTDPGLNRAQYKVATVEAKWIPALDGWTEPAPGAVPGFVEKLCHETLEARAKKGHRAPTHAFFDACSRLWGQERAAVAALRAEVVRMRLEVGAAAAEALAARKRQARVLGFDDLLQQLDAALRGARGASLAGRLRARYPIALIDEFQDTDPVQYRIFRRLHDAGRGEGGLYLIGDPKQAIYSFRGADVFAYLGAARDSGEARYTLGVNYRSDPGLLRGLERLFGGARMPFAIDAIDFHPVAPAPNAEERLVGPGDDRPLQWLWLDPAQLGQTGRVSAGVANDALPELIAAEVGHLLQSDARLDGAPVRPGDVAVLCRTNRQARATQRALRALGVPAVLEGDDSVFDAETAEELTRVLAALAEPGDHGAVRAALSTTLLGVDAAGLDALHHDEGAWDTWLSRVHAFHRTWHERGWFAALHQLIDVLGVQARLLGLPDGERRLTDLMHLSELLHRAERAQHLGPLSLLSFLRTMRLDPEQRGLWTVESAQVRLESDALAVQLTTVHKSKGLEYPVVFCPFMWSGRLLFTEERAMPRFHRPTDGQLCMDVGSDALEANRKLAEREALGEQLRLTYVALTRAKHRCYVVWGPTRDAPKSALAYLLHQGAAQDADDVPGHVVHRVKELPAEALLEELHAMAASAPDAIGVRPLRAEAGSYVPAAVEEPALSCRRLARPLPSAHRVGSFTGLLRGAEARASGTALDVGPDHDAEAPAPEAAEAEAGTMSQRVRLADFPAGARVGSMIHHVYEHLDFTAPHEAVQAQVTQSLSLFGYGPQLGDPLAQTVADSLAVPLLPDGPCLRDVPRHDRLDELEFMLQVGRGGVISAAGVAEVLRSHGEPELAHHAAQLPANALTGYLRGYVDLVFRHGGRYYVVDYKSNRLGKDSADYAAARLRRAMLEHHYYLQYLLYVVAVDRHLRSRDAGYRYEDAFGGVAYLFVRGMSPDHPAGCGVYFTRPARALVESLDAYLRQGGAA